MREYGIYIRVDERGRILAVNSEGLLPSHDGWIMVGEYESDVPYAQGNYFPDLLVDERGVPRYAYDPDSPGKWRERSPEEMDADDVPPAPTVSETDLALVELAGMLAEQQAALIELAGMIAGGDK